MPSTPPSVAVVGPGAIGTVVAAALAEAGRPPALYGRTARPQLDLEVEGEGAHVTVPGPVRTDPDAAERPADVVLLAVKATQLEGAAPWLEALAGPDTVVGVLENGVEQVAQVTPLAPRSAIVPSVVWFPAERGPDGSVLLRGEPRLSIPTGAPADRVAEALASTRCVVERADDFPTVAWRKLLQNAVAGLMALSGRRSGMFRRDDIAALAEAYAREGLAVARAEGARLSDDVPHDIVERFRSAPADLITSILVDREAGRPLEWDVRNGVLVRLGRAHGIPTPISDVLVPLLAAASDGPG